MLKAIKEKIELHKLKKSLNPTLRPNRVRNRVLRNSKNGQPAIIINDYKQAYGNYIVVSDLNKKNKIRKEKGKRTLNYPKLSKPINKSNKKLSYVNTRFMRNPKTEFNKDKKLRINRKDYKAIVKKHIEIKSRNNIKRRCKRSFKN